MASELEALMFGASLLQSVIVEASVRLRPLQGKYATSLEEMVIFHWSDCFTVKPPPRHQYP